MGCVVVRDYFLHIDVMPNTGQQDLSFEKGAEAILFRFSSLVHGE